MIRTASGLDQSISWEAAIDIYHVWCDLKPGAGDTEFADMVQGFLAHLKDAGQIADFRLTRRKLGLGPAELGEFHITIEAEDLAQLDRAFAVVSGRAEPEEGLHFPSIQWFPERSSRSIAISPIPAAGAAKSDSERLDSAAMSTGPVSGGSCEADFI